MKKIVIVSLFVLVVTTGKVFAAGDENVSLAAKRAFERKFPNVEYAKWEQLGNYDIYSVRFISNNKSLVVYFSEEGEMIASARIAGKDNLPQMVDYVIRKMYNDSEILKVEELTMGGRLSYFFTIETETSRKLVRIYSDGSVEKIKTEKKKISRKQ